jgi:putative membrane protein
MMHNWNDGWGPGNWLLMGFGMLLFWTLVVVAIVWLVRSTAHRQTAAPHGVPMDKPAGPVRPSALDILDERYARGEIDHEEYRTRRDALGAP